jgi:Copper binding proteins, plastocyanin/azurin family
MRRSPAALIVIALAFLVALPASAARTQQPRETLRGEVGPGFTIFLRHADGRNVTQLDAGEYRIVVEDRSIEHNFHLSGAGVDRATSVENVETVTWDVTFADAQRYTFVCDPHSTTMRGTFNVGKVPPPPPPPVVRRLSASVTARAIAVRTASGSRARSVVAGRYRISVRDAARTQNFHLIGPGVNRRTSVGRTSRPTWTLTLRRGTYTYRSDANRRLRGTFRAR